MLGPNRCRAGGCTLSQNETAELRQGDQIELLENQHIYTVEFSSNNEPTNQSQKDLEMVGKQTTLNDFVSIKRKDASNRDGDETSAAKKRKTDEEIWNEVDGGKLIVFSTSQPVEHKSKVMLFQHTHFMS